LWILFIFSIEEFFNPSVVANELTLQLRNKGPFRWVLKHKIAIFMKMTLTVLFKFQYFMEAISLNKTTEVIPSQK
jgi:hypothetical protein